MELICNKRVLFGIQYDAVPKFNLRMCSAGINHFKYDAKFV